MGLEGNTEEIQADTDDDSILLLRQMYLTSLAKEAATKGKARAPTAPQPDPMFYFLEHPQDPAVGSPLTSGPQVLHDLEDAGHARMAKTPGRPDPLLRQCTFGQVYERVQRWQQTYPWATGRRDAAPTGNTPSPRAWTARS